jgi:Tfp pilus assembly protein PilN
MAQQLNLYSPALRVRPVGPTAASAVRWLALAAAVFLVTGLALAQWAHRQASSQGDTPLPEADQQARLGETKARLATRRHAIDAEMQRLRAQEQAAQKVRQTLNEGRVPDSAEPYSSYFKALARQADGALWLTGFSVSADGKTLEIRGRALNASALPNYLERLRREPVFKGRTFAQLQLGSVAAEGAAAPILSDFVLRSQALGQDRPKEARP